MKKSSVFLIALVFALGFGFSSFSYAAEGSHRERSQGKAAVDGHCPVCIIGGKVVDGNKNFATEYKGKVYYFFGINQQKMFINDPEKYIANLEKKYRDLKTRGGGAHKAEGSHMMEEGSH